MDICRNEGVSAHACSCIVCMISTTCCYSMQFKGLFRGMLYPMASQVLINATVFGVENAVYRYLSKGENEVNYGKKFYSSVAAGAVQCIIVCPTELIKIRMQNQGVNQKYSERKIGPRKAADSIWRKDGIRRGFYRGWWLTIAREVPQYSIYFCTFKWLQEYIMSRRKLTDASKLSWLDNALAGGITGVATWLWYPVDIIKTKFQAEGASSKYKGIWDCVKQTKKEEGLRGLLFKGIKPTLIRGFLNGMVCLSIAESIKHKM